MLVITWFRIVTFLGLDVPESRLGNFNANSLRNSEIVMSFDFIPRKLQNVKKVQHKQPVNPRKDVAQPTGLVPDAKGKQKAETEAISDDDILLSLRLTFSDYTLWKDQNLREMLANPGDEGCK